MKKILSALLLLVSSLAFAQDNWPNKPVKIIIPYAVGGDLELLMRKAEKRLEEEFKQQLVIEIKPGAGGNIGAAELAKANNDGYTWLFALDSILTANPFVFPNTYNTNDIKPLTFVATRSSVLLCRSDLNIKTFKDFLDIARNKNLSFAHTGAGNPSFIMMESIRNFYKLDVTPVPYQGVAPSIQAVASKQIDCTFGPAVASMGPIQANLIQPIAYSGDKRSVLFTDLPTLKELGYKGVSGNAYFTLYAQRNTPELITNKMLQIFEKVFKNEILINEAKSFDHLILMTNTKDTEVKINELMSINSQTIRK